MWIIVLLLLFLWFRSEEGMSADGLTQAQSSNAAQLAAASQVPVRHGLPALAPVLVLSASGLTSADSDPRLQISVPSSAIDPTSINTPTTGAGGNGTPNFYSGQLLGYGPDGQPIYRGTVVTNPDGSLA